jgi:hypothetical protein
MSVDTADDTQIVAGDEYENDSRENELKSTLSTLPNAVRSMFLAELTFSHTLHRRKEAGELDSLEPPLTCRRKSFTPCTQRCTTRKPWQPRNATKYIKREYPNEPIPIR